MPARPPSDLEPAWTVDPRSGMRAAAAPRATVNGDEVTLEGEVAFVPDAPGAELLVAVGVTDDGIAGGGGDRGIRRRRAPSRR